MIFFKNRSQSQRGYTIIEVMIVLVVSSVLFVGAAAGISRQNRRTQFTQSVQTLQQRLQDVLNDVQTGYYITDNSYSCSAGNAANTPVSFNPVANSQGKNVGCTFVGKYIQSSPLDEGKITVSTIAGRQKVAGPSSADVSNIEDAVPVIAPTVKDDFNLDYGLKLKKLVLLKNNTTIDSRDFAIISSFTPASAGGQGSKIGTRGLLSTVNNVDGDGKMTMTQGNIDDASGGILLCLDDGDRKATITIGGVNQGDPQVVIDSNDTRCDS